MGDSKRCRFRQAPFDPRRIKSRLSKTLSPVVALLAISVFINYIDRGSLSIAAPALKDELHFSAGQLGMLLSSFFWTYAGFQILSGWLVDRFNVNWVMAGGFFVWSIATAATGLIHGFQMLLVMRLLLGVGESVAFPSYSKILAKHFPEFVRGRANAFIAVGIAAGPAFGIFFGAILMARYGWRPFFVGLGLICLLWLLPWMKWMPKGPGMAVSCTAQAPSIPEILKQRSAWGTFAGLFSYNYLSYFLLTWLPFYLVRERHFSMQNMGRIGGAAYLILATSALISGWISDLWISRGGPPTRVAKDIHGIWAGGGFLFLHCSCCVRFRFTACTVFSFRDLRRGWVMHFQSMGHHADAGGSAGGRQMDGVTEFRRQFRRDRFAGADRTGGRANRAFLLGVCCNRGSFDGWGNVLGICGWPG